MTTESSYLGLSQVSWEIIFQILKISCPAIILALFDAYYQRIKKGVVTIRQGLTISRVSSYERVAALLSTIGDTESPTLKESAIYNEILLNFDFPDINVDYIKCLASEDAYDNFYKTLTDLVRECRIYLDYDICQQCEKSISIFTQLKNFLDAYADTERATTNDQTHAMTNKIDTAYKITAIAMKSECNRAFLQLEDAIANKMQNISVDYGQRRIKRLAMKCKESVMRWADKRMDDDSLYGSVSRWLLMKFLDTNAKMMILAAPQLIEIYAYLHVRDQYTPKQYFAMSDAERDNITLEFKQFYYLQLHHY